MADDPASVTDVPWNAFSNSSAPLSSGKAPLASKAPAAAPTPAAPPATPKDAQPTPAEAASHIGEGSAKASKTVDALNAQSMHMTPPTLQTPPKPDNSHRNDIDMWGSMAIAFAGLGGLMSRNHVTTALTAASAALKGIQEKNTHAATEAYKVWEVESKNAIDVANFQEKAYNAILGNLRHSEDLAVRKGTEEERTTESRVKAAAVAMKDPVMTQAMNEHGLAGAVEIQKALEKHKEGMEKHRLGVMKNFGAYSALNDLHESERYKNAAPEERLEMDLELQHKVAPEKMNKLQPMTPEQEDFMAQRLAAYDMPPPGQFLRRQPGWTEALQRAKEINPDYRESDYPTIQAAKKDLTTGKAAQTLKSLSALQQHLTFFSELAKELPTNADLQLKNKITAEVAKRVLGRADVTNFEAAREIVGAETIKAVAGAGAGSVSDREGIKKQFDTAESPAQLQGAINTVRTLVGGQVKAIEDQFSSLPKIVKDRYLKPEILGFYRPNESGHKPEAKSTQAAPIVLDPTNREAAKKQFDAAAPDDWLDLNGKVMQKKDIGKK